MPFATSSVTDILDSFGPRSCFVIIAHANSGPAELNSFSHESVSRTEAGGGGNGSNSSVTRSLLPSLSKQVTPVHCL